METLAARCSDISEGGMRLVTGSDAALAAGEVLSLEFSIPEITESIKLRGVIRHGSGFGYGVEFINLGANERYYITAFCRRLAKGMKV